MIPRTRRHWAAVAAAASGFATGGLAVAAGANPFWFIGSATALAVITILIVDAVTARRSAR